MFFSLLIACTFFDNPPDVVNESVSLYVADSAIQISTAKISQVPINSEEHFIGWSIGTDGTVQTQKLRVS